MRISIALLSPVLAVLSSCAGGPTIADDGTMPFAAPMGETATPTAQAAPCLLTSQCLPLHWHDRFGAEWEGELEVVCESDSAHEHLACMCLIAHWPHAMERCQLLAEQAMIETAADAEQVTGHLQRTLDQALFPCESQGHDQQPVGRVRGLNWKVLRKRRSGHTFDYQPLMRRN